MSAPRRLLDERAGELGAWSDPEAADLARSLLSSGADVEPPAAASGAVWASLEAAILIPAAGLSSGSAGGGGSASAASTAGATSAGAASSSAAAATTVASQTGSAATTAVVATKGLLLTAKIGLATLVVGGAVATGVLATRSPAVDLSDATTAEAVVREAPSVEEPARSMILAPPRTEAAALPEAAVVPEAAALPEGGGDGPSAARARTRAGEPADATRTPSAEERATALQSEAAGVQRARAELARGDANGALATLASLDREVPRGVLGQERALYTMLALSAAGQHARAARNAEAFLRTWPNSPHAPRVRELLTRR